MLYKKNRLSLFTIIISVLLLISNFAYAQDGKGYIAELQTDIQNVLVLIIKTLSWIWILVANLAWKFMSNAFVSGSIVWLDKYLFQARNIVRIIANFLLMIMLFKIGFDVLKVWSPKGLWTKITKAIIAGLLINVSWFLLGAIVDVSTIMTTAVSSIWNNLVNSSPWLKWNLQRQFICIPKVYHVSYDNKNTNIQKIPWCLTGDNELIPNWSEYYSIYTWDSIINKISPTQDDMSGPLFYYGISIFRFFDYVDINSASIWWYQSITIWFLIKLFLMLMFITPLIALLVINFKRMIMIRIRFATAPFVVLKNIMGKDTWFTFIDNIWEWAGGMISKNSNNFFNIWSIVWAIFTPVTIIASLYISLFIIGAFAWQLMPATNNTTTTDKLWSELGELGSKISIDGDQITLPNGSFSLDADFVNTKDFIWGSIWYLLMTLFVVMLLRAIFKVGLSTSELMWDTGTKIMDSGKKTFTQNVTIPTANGPVSLDQLDKKILTMDNMSKNIENITWISADKKRYKDKFDRDVKNSWVGKYLWRAGKIDPGNRFDPGFGKKFNTPMLDGKIVKDTDNKLNFEQRSYEYFKGLHKSIYDPQNGGIVDPSYSYAFVRNMRARLDGWWYEYLVENKVIWKDKYVTETKDDDWKIISRSVNFDALIKEENKFGLLVKKLLDKWTKYSNSNDAEFFRRIVEEAIKASSTENVKFSTTKYGEKR